jgi:hypothetical protein
MRKYIVRRRDREQQDHERESLLRRCYVVETSDGVVLEVGDRIVMRFDSLHAFLVAFELTVRDLRDVGA